MADQGPRVAMLGAGLAAAPYLYALPALGADLVAVATRNEERFAHVSDVFPSAVRCWPPGDVFDHGPLDAVLILAPPASHLESITLCAANGVPAVLEKPVETTPERARGVRRLAEEAGIPVAVMLQYRYRQAARDLHGLIQDGTLGTIQAATLDFRWWRAQSYYDEPGRGSYRRDGGGVLMTQAIHALDLLLWYLGVPGTVAALLGRGRFHRLEAEDVASALLKYPEGGTASIFATSGARGRDRMVLRLFGDSATVELTENTLVVHADVGEPLEYRDDSDAYDGSHPMAFTGEWHLALLADALAAFARGVAPPVGLDDGIRVLDLISALEAADRAGEWVEIRDDSSEDPPRGEPDG